MITGNVIGGTLRNPETIILYDESTGIEYTAAMVDSEDVELTATVNDVREGKVVALSSGVETGEKFIPSYHTTEGFRLIPDGSEYSITNLLNYDRHKFTKLQAIICEFNSLLSDSVSAHKVSIDSKLYEVNSTIAISIVSSDDATKFINFGLINNSGKLQVLRYFTYKET